MKRKVLGVVLAAMCISVAPVSAYAAAGNSGVQDVISKIADAVSGSDSEGTADAAADAQTEIIHLFLVRQKQLLKCVAVARRSAADKFFLPHTITSNRV